MNFPEGAEHGLGAEAKAARAARVIPGGGLGAGLERRHRDAALGEDGGGIGLGVEGIGRTRRAAPMAGGDVARADAGGDQSLAARGRVGEHRAHLEQAEIGEPAIGVAPGGGDQSRQDRGAEIGKGAGNGVFQAQIIAAAAEQPRVILADEGIGHGFNQAAGGEAAPGEARAPLGGGRHRLGQGGRPREGKRRNLGVTLDPQDLFHQIGRTGDVAAPARHRDAQAAGIRAGLEAQRVEDFLGAVLGHLQAAEPRHVADREGEAEIGFRRRPGDHQSARLAAADFQDQLGGRLHAGLGGGRVDAALETKAGIGFDAEPAPGGRRADGVEQRRLDQHVDRALPAGGRRAAHDAPQGQHAVIIGDHADAVAQGVVLAVQGRQALAGGGQPHHQAAGDGIGVEHVQRAAPVEGEIIADVDQRRNRAKTHRQKFFLEPGRAFDVFHAADGAADEMRAGSRRLGREIEGYAHRALIAALHRCRHQRFQHPQAGRRQVPGDAVNAEAIAAVGGDGDIDDGIAKTQRVGGGAAQRRVGLELDDARMIVAELQFQRRTHHARRFDPPDPGLLEIEPGARNMAADGGEHAGQAGPRIVRPAHHLDLLRAIVDQADLEFIGVGMGRHLRDFGHHETFKAGGAVMDAFELEPQRRQGVGHFAEGCLGVQMFLEPTEGEFHRASPPTRLGWSSAAKP